jgi:hypothetical protein
MTQPAQDPLNEDDEERRNRERKLDDTLEDSFPASDPLSTNPNPDNPGADDHEPPAEKHDRSPTAERNTAR